MGSSIKVSASTAERLIMYTGHLSAFTRQESNTKPHGGDAPWRAHLPPEAPFQSRPAHVCPQLPPHTGNTPPIPKTGKKGHGPAHVGQDIQAWQSPVPVCARHKLQEPRKEENSLKFFFPSTFHSKIPLL